MRSKREKRLLAGDKLNPALKSFIDNAIVPILVREWVEQVRQKPADLKIRGRKLLEENSRKRG